MNNVEAADKMVHAIKSFKMASDGKQFVIIPHDECDFYIKGLERLRMMERNLLNLTSRAYDAIG